MYGAEESDAERYHVPRAEGRGTVRNTAVEVSGNTNSTQQSSQLNPAVVNRRRRHTGGRQCDDRQLEQIATAFAIYEQQTHI